MTTQGNRIVYKMRSEMSCLSMDDYDEREVRFYLTGPSGLEEYAGRTIYNTRTGDNRLPEVGE